jgi:site-specific DNA recombinase
VPWFQSAPPTTSDVTCRGLERAVYASGGDDDEVRVFGAGVDGGSSGSGGFASVAVVTCGGVGRRLGAYVTEFFDVGHSRRVSWLRRPESARLLAALEDPGRGFEALVIGEPQRVFYDNQFGLVFPLFEHFGVGLWVPEVGGPIDPDCEAHGLIMSVFAGMSKAERRRIQIRVRSAMIAQVEREGRFLGGRPPYGYRLADAGPHHNPALAALGARRHQLDLDPRAASVVKRIFAMRIAGSGARRIARALDADDIACPSAHDPARNRHRSGAGWTTGTILAILGNPRYTGHEVWNKQSKTDVLIDPHNVGLGVRTSMRWNPRAEWVSSPKMAHPAIVNADDFEHAQHAPAIRGTRRTYLLRGLLHCVLCGRRMEGAWNNGRANYRCQHRVAGSELPGSVGVLRNDSGWSASMEGRAAGITRRFAPCAGRAEHGNRLVSALIIEDRVALPGSPRNGGGRD